MNQDYTHITVVLDSSGSMANIREDTIGGFNTFLKQQQEAPGKATLTQIHFSSGKFTPGAGAWSGIAMPVVPYIHNPITILNDFSNIQVVEPLSDKTFVPGGSTPLLDSIGDAILKTGAKLAEMPEAVRPAKVLFVVITDGQENASTRFTKAKIQEMIKHQQSVYSWGFLFLGANMDAIAEGVAMGFNFNSSAQYTCDAASVGGTYTTLGEKVKMYRSARGAIATAGALNFTAEDREMIAGMSNTSIKGTSNTESKTTL